ncbi:unnamed protein product [Hyaloperonospora brassicae]|uniref:BEACH domain-containing protein n=1 Tax=Hyaloperonospora brassicae TaxID=162125 RepID=A0AAV0UQL0_HYABA|nr:unnamed protein product [Hyaloperonospora brassicae]
MSNRRRSTKTIQATRFSLLLLEDGEWFLDDHCACWYLEPWATTPKEVPGRLKVCTRGLFFVPHDLQVPILRFPFRSMDFEPMAECFGPIRTHSDISNTNGSTKTGPVVYLTFKTQQVIAMRTRGIDHPYIYKSTTNNGDVPIERNAQQNICCDLFFGKNKLPAKYVFTLRHVTIEAFLASIHVVYRVSTMSPRRALTTAEESTPLAPVLSSRWTDKFDPSLLVDFRERLLMERGCVADRIEPLLKFPGCLMLTTKRLYFEPALLNNVLDLVLNWEYTKVDQVYKRRYLLQPIGLEMFLSNGDSFFFSFRSPTERDDFYALLVEQPELQRCCRQDLQYMMRQWQRREVSNFEYLLFLNNASGRTRNDLTQYPVFPWILCDYTSPELALDDPAVYRDLTKPIGALNDERLAYLKARYEGMPRGAEAEELPPPFLYGTHYSTPGYVVYFLLRKVPEYMLCLQSGKFDAPDRLFRSVKVTWDGCLSNHADVKELIPEFFDCACPADEWLRNMKHLDFGSTQNRDRVDDVVLPPWAHGSATEFVQKNRAALESDYVSDHLHHWIDLIFGYKQQGDEAVKADNLFYYLSYEGSVDIQAIADPVQKCSLEAQIQEFGQTPKLLFSTPHPSRNESSVDVEVATPDLLVSPRVQVPYVRKSLFVDEMSKSRFQRRYEGTQTALEEYTESEGEANESSMPVYDRQNSWHQYSLICSETSLQCFPITIKAVSARLRKSIRSGKARKKWKWKSRLRTKYSLSVSWGWKQSSASQLHKGEVTSTVLSRDGSFVFTTSKDCSLKMSSTKGVTPFRSVSGKFALSCCDVSPDESIVLCGSWDNSVYMVSARTGQVLDMVVAHSDGISAIRVLQRRFLTSSWDSSIRLWRYTASAINVTPIRTFLDCEESVWCLAVSSNEQFGAAGTRNESVYVFNLDAAVLYSHAQVSSEECPSGISSVSFANDNKSYVCITMRCEVFQCNLRGEKLWSMEVHTAGPVQCFDSDGDYAVGGTSAGSIVFWKLHERAGAEEVFELPRAHEASITCLAVSCSGSLLVSGARDGSVHVWKLEQKLPLHHPTADPLCWSRGSEKLPSGSGTLTSTLASTTRTSTSMHFRHKSRMETCEWVTAHDTFRPIVQLAEAQCCLEC